jgi:hypothetical protein
MQTLQNAQDRRDILAQWAFDTRPILGRFHLWLDDIETEWRRGRPQPGQRGAQAFVGGRIERLLAMTAAATALGTQIYGPYGGGRGLDKAGVNQVKKDADAISAYVMSESLWYLSRQLPENHAIMVCLGEGLMPKAGETPEMGANPQLGFGRVYARPEIAQWLDERVSRLLNDPRYDWDDFYGELKRSGIVVWGAAIDTLENTSRFASGAETGPMTVLHLFNQPLHVMRPYEGYAGNLVLPRRVLEAAEAHAILINFRTPRTRVLEAIELAYPGIRREHIHVWTLGGKSRVKRIGSLWKTWTDLGVHLVEDGWTLPTGMKAFNESGTYAPTYLVGSWEDAGGQTHVLFCDGYAASAEALQAASLDRLLGVDTSMNIFTSKFDLAYDREQRIMQLDPDAPDFASRLQALLDGQAVDGETLADYRRMIHEGLAAGLDLRKSTLAADDFFPEKRWEVLAAVGYMLPDPYTGAPGVQTIGPDQWKVTVRMLTEQADKLYTFSMHLMETHQQGRLVFSPLLNRFLGGEDYRQRPVKVSDSGRIRNELQTLCAEALEFPGHNQIRIFFDRIGPNVIAPEKQLRLMEILQWYKERHPIWFSWLEIVPPGLG